MFHRIKRWAVLVLAGIFLLCAPFELLAASKPINSISIKVTSKIEAGSRLPDIQIGTGNPPDGGVLVSEKGSHFTVTEAEWLDKSSQVVTAADEPRMKVILEPDDVSEYYFLASYKVSNVKVSGGTFVSAKRDGDALVVTLRVKPVKGDYDSPRDAYWNEKNLGEARWDKPDNDSGYYEVQLYRDNKNVHKVSKTSSRTYNFYPYMTEKGDYTFKVRTIPGTTEQNKYGNKSEWIESGELQITDRYVSDGKGQQNSDPTVVKGTKDKVGWFQEGTAWGYRYPDGKVMKGGWLSLDGAWYYFDGSGVMATGWQQINGEYFYLHDNGQMAVGWTKVGDHWYFLRTEAEGQHPAGSMIAPGWQVIGSNYYYFNSDGSMFTGWLVLDGKRYYMNTLENGLQGAMFTGWILRDEKTYFADSNGQIMEGWCQVDGLWHYFYPGTGEMAVNTQIDGLPIGLDGVWRG